MGDCNTDELYRYVTCIQQKKVRIIKAIAKFGKLIKTGTKDYVSRPEIIALTDALQVAPCITLSIYNYSQCVYAYMLL